MEAVKMLSSAPPTISSSGEPSGPSAVTPLCSSGCPSTPSVFIRTSCIPVSAPMSLPVPSTVSTTTSVTASLMHQQYEGAESVSVSGVGMLPRSFLPVASLGSAPPPPQCVQVRSTATVSVLDGREAHQDAAATTTSSAAALAAAAAGGGGGGGGSFSLEDPVLGTAPMSTSGFSLDIPTALQLSVAAQEAVASAAAATAAAVAAAGAEAVVMPARTEDDMLKSIGAQQGCSPASEDSDPLPIAPVPLSSGPAVLSSPMPTPTISSDSTVTTTAPLPMPFKTLTASCPAVASATAEFTTICSSSAMPINPMSVLSHHGGEEGGGGGAGVSDGLAVAPFDLASVVGGAGIGVIDVADPLTLAKVIQLNHEHEQRQQAAARGVIIKDELQQHGITVVTASAAMATAVAVSEAIGVPSATPSSLPPPLPPPPPPSPSPPLQSLCTPTSSATVLSPSPLPPTSLLLHDIPVAHPLTSLKRAYDLAAGGDEPPPLRLPNVVSVEFIQNRRPFRCSHAGCEKTFKNQQTLMMHHKTHFVEDGSLKLDMEGIPMGVRAGRNKKIPSRCPECGRTFVGLYELRRHYGRKHSQGEKMFSCKKCGKKFFIDVDLRDHEKFCGEAIQCRCGMKFAYKCNLVAHKKANPACQGGGPGQVHHHNHHHHHHHQQQQQRQQQQQVTGSAARQQGQQHALAAVSAAEGQRYKKLSSSSASSSTCAASSSPLALGSLSRATMATNATTPIGPAVFHIHLPHQRQQLDQQLQQQQQQQQHPHHNHHHHHLHHPHQTQMGAVTAVTQGVPMTVPLLPYVLTMPLPSATAVSSAFARDGGHLTGLQLQSSQPVLSIFDASRGSSHVQSPAAAMAVVRGS